MNDLPRNYKPVTDEEAEALTRVHQLEHQIEGAHSMMDMIGIPRDYPHIDPPRKLTIQGRLAVFNDLMPGAWELLAKAIEEYVGL